MKHLVRFNFGVGLFNLAVWAFDYASPANGVIGAAGLVTALALTEARRRSRV